MKTLEHLMGTNTLTQRLFGYSDKEGTEGAPSESEELGYSFEAIDFLDDESKRLYRIWLDAAIDHTRADGRYSVTLNDLKATRGDALRKFSDAER